ncbi:MAG: hypothetical protein WB764_09670 [Xanthobacteraceae bacterium]
MDATMIDIEIAGMVGINLGRRDVANVPLHQFDQVEERHGIEAIIRQPMGCAVLDAEDFGGSLHRRFAPGDGLFAGGVSAGFAVSQNDRPHLVAGKRVTPYRAAAAQNFIVGMSHDDGNAPISAG